MITHDLDSNINKIYNIDDKLNTLYRNNIIINKNYTKQIKQKRLKKKKMGMPAMRPPMPPPIAKPRKPENEWCVVGVEVRGTDDYQKTMNKPLMGVIVDVKISQTKNVVCRIFTVDGKYENIRENWLEPIILKKYEKVTKIG